ncbi:MAG: TRAM domain-containing protein [Acidilobaceae archaeon]
MSEYRGRIVEAVVTERGYRDGSLVARLENYIPVIIQGNGILGARIKVKIVNNTFFDLRGELLESRIIRKDPN